MSSAKSSRAKTSRPTGGRLRIVAGSLRGSRLDVPDKPGLRPTPDRVRETLFNWLAPIVNGARCLDLFAGTGALGIEALSRGASSCVFVERDAQLARAIEANLERLKITNASVRSGDALAMPIEGGQRFDLVFLDPPFDANLWDAAIARFATGSALGDTAWIYIESPATLVPEVPKEWSMHREGRSGAVRHALYRRTAADPLS
ncbi:MAG: 16S rRNA (guanine(966)-N(2))-methyltransferase RsmD [Dokdonella sp.]